MEKMYYKDILENMENDLGNNYSVGLHTLRTRSETQKSNLVSHLKTLKLRKEIMKQGWKFNHYGTVYFTVYCYGLLKGILENDDYKGLSFQSYNYWREKNINNIIIAVPHTINIDGENFFVGVLENNGWTTKGTFLNIDSSLADSFLIKDRIPTEFIYGYYKRQAESTEEQSQHMSSVSIPDGIRQEYLDQRIYEFQKNPNHVCFMNEKEQSLFYKRLLKDQGLSLEQLRLTQEGKADDPISLNTYLQKQSYEEGFSRNK